MVSFDVLDPKESIVEGRFLQASAGTGKTFAIEHIVVRLLLEKELEIKCEDILVVTFTRAATRELQSRIRQNLKKAITYLEGKEGSSVPYLDIFVSQEDKKKAIRRLEEALSAFEQMQIFTIHGFCYQMLKRYAFDAGISFIKQHPDDRSYEALMRREILNVLRGDLTLPKFHRYQIHKVLKKYSHDISKLTRALLRYVEKDTSLLVYTDYEHLLKQFKEQCLQKEHLSRVEEDLLSLAPHFKGLTTTSKELHERFLLQARYFKKEACLETLFESLLAEEDLFFDYLREELVKKTSKQNFRELESQFSIFKLRQTIGPILEEARDLAKILAGIVILCKKRIEKALAYHKQILPDDFLKLLEKLLFQRDFCEKIQKRYKAAIIDEFQDTDPLQWEIFNKLFVEGKEKFPLFLVGDPKQSIYAFRNADLPTYLKAAQSFLPHQHKSLATNYRSEPGLVHALNQLFSLSNHLFSEDSSLAYEEVSASMEAKDTLFDDGLEPVHFFITEEKSSREKVFPTKEMEEFYIFPYALKEIRKFMEKGIPLSKIAILIRDRFQGKRIEAYLRRHGIVCLTSGVENITETLAFEFFKVLIEMVGQPLDRSLTQRVLTHSFMGFSLEELEMDLDNQTLAYATSQLSSLSKLYQEEGFLSFWETFLNTSFHKEGPSFEKRLLQSKDIEGYLDLCQIVEIVLKTKKEPFFSYEELLICLETLQNLDPEEDLSVKRKKAQDENAVIIMTIHKSKGLEFDIVFALGVAVKSRSQEGLISSPGEMLSKVNEEKIRQLYVALTRAKKRLYIPLCFEEDKSCIECEEVSPIELFLLRSGFECTKSGFLKLIAERNFTGISHSILHRQMTSFDPILNEEKKLLPPQKYTKTYPARYRSSYSSLVIASERSRAFQMLEGELPASAETGIVLHKILEKIFERGLYKEFDEKIIKHLLLQEIEVSHLKGFEDSLYAMLKTVMTIKIPYENGFFCFRDLKPSELVTEMDFLFRESAVSEKTGIIDLFFKYQDKYYLVDWKSNYLEKGYERASLESCIESYGYRIQAEIYSKAIEKYLEEKGCSKASFGGIFYIFLRGIKENTFEGVYHFV